MISNNSLSRRLSAIEAKAAGEPETVCMFIMPGEDEKTAMARRFGPAGPPLGAKVVAFTWQPMQDEPGHGGGL
jgi:hypothetical protein